ncbi:MAG: flagellin [Gemmatimonadetes bacterium]|nr:flagellin [Gemmatimonadota bacterium]MBT6619391.1 flagellin [Gemmatimonadota bacterium]
MALRINSNVSAMSTAHTMSANNKDLGTRLERLSSGMRINTAADDAAGLSISEGFRAQITGLTMGVRNAEMGSNLVQVAEGSLNEVSSMLIRMRELAVQSSSSTFTDQNREAIEAEVNQLKQEIDRIAESTVYNDKTLLTGFGNTLDATSSSALTDVAQTGVKNISISGVPAGTYTMADNADGTISIGNGVVSQTINFNTVLDGNQMATGTTSVLNFDRLGINVTIAGSEVADVGGDYTAGDLDGKTIVVNETAGGSFQVGADDVAEDRIEVNIADMRASGVLLNLNTVSLGTQASARSSIARIDQAIDNTSQARGDLGSIMNRLQHTINFTDNSIENNTNSESALRDTDMAAEVTLFTRSQILSQAATAMLAQANTTPQQALGLLGQ